MKQYKIIFFMCSIIAAPATFAGTYQSPLQTHPSQGDIRTITDTSASLFSADQGVAVKVATRGLTPGHVYTLWFAVVNKPDACESVPDYCKAQDVLKQTRKTQSDVVYADGVISNARGEAKFSAYIPKGKSDEYWFGNGLQNPLSAEVHLIVNEHGPSRFPHLDNMLTSYRGGCTDESLPAAFPAKAKADGVRGPNRCRMVQMVRFQQHP